MSSHSSFFFFFNDTATTEIYTLSLHDALPIWGSASRHALDEIFLKKGPQQLHCRLIEGRKTSESARNARGGDDDQRDRKSTRLNSSHQIISYAVFCLKKKTDSEQRS